MKLFRSITLFFALTFASQLQAQFQSFNIGEGFGQVALSPDGIFLAFKRFSTDSIELWNTQTGQRHGNTPIAGNDPFFSSDSTMLLTTQRKKINSYRINQDDIEKSDTLKLDDPNFNFDLRKSYACLSDGKTREFIKLSLYSGVFISKVSPDGLIQTQQLDRDDIGFYIHTPQTCAITFDAHMTAIACAKCSLGCPYIHVVDLNTRQTKHNYHLRSSDIISINFSQDKTKLIVAVGEAWREVSKAKKHIIIIDLTINQSSWFEQEQIINYGAWANNATALILFKDGTVQFQTFTPEDLESNRVTEKKRFNVIEDPRMCD